MRENPFWIVFDREGYYEAVFVIKRVAEAYLRKTDKFSIIRPCYHLSPTAIVNDGMTLDEFEKLEALAGEMIEASLEI